ncbi:hypothetical protein [Kitasatospora sp. NPDC002040]|uniref:hypothetical protein n=1 Tax=Kitasatospora sp. NPDC002040 TaxID=3154661 RepID=UPI00332B0152
MTRRTIPLRRVLATALLGAALSSAAGCGIRPTAVPVDAGAPASRTACPTPVRVPQAAEPTTAEPGPDASGLPTPAPSALPKRPGNGSKSPEVLFSAAPSSTAPSATACP